jgi:mono/diheme cytochrome c family protein
MSSSRTRKNTIRSVFALSALVGVLAISGCFPSDGGDKKNGNTYDSLHVPRAILRDTGAVVYAANCVGCHGGEGQGERGPQVANSDFVMNNRERVIKILLQGNVDSLRVNGVFYDGGGMPAWGDQFSNLEIAGILTYFRSVLNDTLVTNCNPNNLDANSQPICERTARNPADMDLDSVAVWEVKAVRDTLPQPETL